VSGSPLAGSPARPRVPVREGLLVGSLDDLAGLRLAGSRCSTCGETSFGVKDICPNCGQLTVESMALGAQGVLWSFTVVRHRPPGDYRGPDPFTPFGLGLVELPDGVRVLSPIECRLEELRIGMELRFRPYLRQDQEKDTVVFAFEPVAPRAGFG
jgi:uncharacterized OB-fold protein